MDRNGGEWVDRLVGVNREAILDSVHSWRPTGVPPKGLFGDGHAAEQIAEALERY